MGLSKPRFLPVFLGFLLMLAMVSLTANSPAFATGAESVIFNFNSSGSGSTGWYPHSSLIEDAQGNLYGTTPNGGTAEVGVVYELSPPATSGGAWTQTILWNFGSYTNDGRNPWTWGAGLAVDGAGNLYGTTQAGGMYAEGTAWELSPPTMSGGAWTETIIWNFGNPAVTDGIDPTSGLTIDENGNLFGTTLQGQSPSLGFSGTVYELSPPSGLSGTWTETILKQFSEGGIENYENGFYPYAGVIGDGSGDLFGTTSSGGMYGLGANPGGVLFEITADGGYSVLWNFSGTYGPSSIDDGADPVSGLIMDKQGNIYGTTALGGTSADFADLINGVGTVFELSPPGAGGGAWTEQVLWNFENNGTDGFSPVGGVVIDPNGNIYGTTEYGGPYSDEPYYGGTAFKLAPPAMTGGSWGETILWDFGNSNSTDGSLPWASLMIDPIGNLFGTAVSGGSFGVNAGSVYEIANAPTTISVATSLALGSSPVGDKIVKNLTVRNTGRANPLFVHVTSSDAEFAPTGATTCSTAGIAPLTSCTIAIGFTPNSLGAHNAMLSVTDNTATSPQHVA
ncbi:MAG: choice-of-anchor tandem repeat GloVer-containing protein, partial [Candidatus Binatus sp.]